MKKRPPYLPACSDLGTYRAALEAKKSEVLIDTWSVDGRAHCRVWPPAITSFPIQIRIEDQETGVLLATLEYFKDYQEPAFETEDARLYGTHDTRAIRWNPPWCSFPVPPQNHTLKIKARFLDQSASATDVPDLEVATHLQLPEAHALAPAESPSLDELLAKTYWWTSFAWGEPTLHIHPMLDWKYWPEDTAFGARVEVLSHGKVIGTAEIWAEWPGVAELSVPFKYFDPSASRDTAEAVVDSADCIRIISDRGLATRGGWGNKYWKGVVEIKSPFAGASETPPKLPIPTPR